jgi:hypothetical protein
LKNEVNWKISDELDDLIEELECSELPGTKPLLIEELKPPYSEKNDNLRLEELFKKYFEDLAKRQNQLDNAYYSYLPEIKD